MAPGFSPPGSVPYEACDGVNGAQAGRATAPLPGGQAPEKLYKETKFLGFTLFTFVFSVAMFFIDLLFLHVLMERAA